MRFLGALIITAMIGIVISITVSHGPTATVATTTKQTINEPAKRAASPKLACDASPKMQAKRKAIIEGLQREQVVYKLTGARVYILPRFYGLMFDDKTKFMNLIYAYTFKCVVGELLFLHIYDAKTNKSIGAFGASGLTL